MNIPKSFLLIDQFIQEHPAYYYALKEHGVGFSISNEDFKQAVIAYGMYIKIDESSIISNGVFNYKGLKITSR